MKKLMYILFAVFALLLTGIAAASAQTDSAVVETTTSNIAVLPGFNNGEIEQVNHEIKTIVLPAIFQLLGSVGINITPFAGILVFVIMLLIRLFEKRLMRDHTANIIENIVSDVSPGKQPISEHHENRLKRFIKHLRGEEQHDEFKKR